MKWEIIHVPGKLPFTLEQSTVDVVVSNIEPKLANILARKLNQICPLEDLRHVKRVRRMSGEGNIELSVILCLSSGHDDLMEGLCEDLVQLMNFYQLKPFKAKVAKFAAISKEEWAKQCELWPTSYHPSHSLDGIVGFSVEDSELIINYMKVAIQLAKSGRPVGKGVNAAVIVDPSSKQVIASACDEICQGPSYMSETKPEYDMSKASELVDYNKDLAQNVSQAECSPLYTEVSCLYPWAWTAKRSLSENSSSKSSAYSWHPLRHAAFAAIEKAAARDIYLFPCTGCSKDQSYRRDDLVGPSHSSPSIRQKTNGEEHTDIINDEHANGLPSDSLRPYLCTGFDIYLVWEPCTMCAMALVHQRIRRIFYAFPNPNAGALGSVYRLQGEKSLNHHYSVFRVLLPEEALLLTDAAPRLLVDLWAVLS